MFAVIETGGKQYRVQQGDVLDVELSPVTEDGQIRFDRVLMVAGESGTRLGNPLVDGAAVEARAVGEVRGPKVRIFKHKRRKQYRRQAGHRQDFLRVRIENIVV